MIQLSFSFYSISLLLFQCTYVCIKVLSVDKPMGIVTRADGERLLVVGVKAKSQAADAGIKPGAYVTAVSARSNSRI